MKKIYLFLCISIIILLLIFTPATMIASENSAKILIEESLTALEKQDFNTAVKSLEKALLLIRDKAPLELNNLKFTEEEAMGFGIYQERENISFSQGETIYFYTEPKNFTIKEIEEDLFEIHIKEDLYILDMEGTILWGQKDFLDYHLLSHSPNSEILITNTVTQDSLFPTGEFQFLLVIKDVFSQKTVEQTIGFIIE
ncbi:MAG: hypothetical protein PHE81_00915 [Atribacterota bacterium]|nr:hypothetical protein [Atribacterota bacterium]MDD4288630.1 hypothetical protein [Atribacterota bacterium]MDD4765512.1 hypothetical protein [Atribacterota bacterium]MDD5635144.1 hypothetical protein [Atribacterota bacterium]MDI9597085.1 hypothetical protein [Atribacterota bacterium]